MLYLKSPTLKQKPIPHLLQHTKYPRTQITILIKIIIESKKIYIKKKEKKKKTLPQYYW